jgi:flagellar motor protein MotB
MSDRENPFAPPPARAAEGAAARPAPDNRFAWAVAALLGIAAVTFGVLWALSLAQLDEAAVLRAKLKQANDALGVLRSQAQRDADQVADLQTKLAGLAQEKATVTQSSKGLEDQLRSELQSKDIAISKLQGKLTLTILDRVMFDSGEAVLKPGGATVMHQIAQFLAQHPDLKIQVVGHTDNIPIHTARFPSNWELSSARALAAVHYLTERAGVAPTRVSAAGCGEFRPIADNRTPDGRARNRRIAITILPDELAAADTSAPKPAAPAGTPPDDSVPPLSLPPTTPGTPAAPVPAPAPLPDSSGLSGPPPITPAPGSDVPPGGTLPPETAPAPSDVTPPPPDLPRPAGNPPFN